MKEKRLTRKRHGRMLFGVSGGLAEYMNIDPVIVRLAFVLMTLLHGWGLLIYAVLAIVMPEEGDVVAKVHPFDEEEIVIKDAS
ncbi:MAG: PspC domain-containing protein [Chloroflexi bacterium]|nr:PspC domain-containing protein [Chloroflexota bacterium]